MDYTGAILIAHSLTYNPPMDILDPSKLHQVDDAGCLYISPVITDWSVIVGYGVDT